MSPPRRLISSGEAAPHSAAGVRSRRTPPTPPLRLPSLGAAAAPSGRSRRPCPEVRIALGPGRERLAAQTSELPRRSQLLALGPEDEPGSTRVLQTPAGRAAAGSEGAARKEQVRSGQRGYSRLRTDGAGGGEV
ncbi:hypothetical protein P7K49_028744 [Saguinus oedipus]|uniref:Uncharacterized protein n=1 Tax=Saguinus oedipus TaxID=9490 RepID=A0ABQ9U595_SAGOE|nr:hypothetical protein P7K49_028744 [Saguinus oedipus]